MKKRTSQRSSRSTPRPAAGVAPEDPLLKGALANILFQNVAPELAALYLPQFTRSDFKAGEQVFDEYSKGREVYLIVTCVAVNPVAALFVFLGAFFYGVVYTVVLKRRTWMNIVVGGLAGSFAILAGATSVGPETIGPVALALAWILFLWTPPHFRSLAIAFHDDYRAANVPILPVVVGDARAARAVLGGTVILVASSLLPLAFGLGPLYAAGALSGGVMFLRAAARLAAAPSRATAMGSFHASLAQPTPAPTPEPVKIILEDIHFEFDKAELTTVAINILKSNIETLKANSGVRVQIEGHACAHGTEAHNMALSERRASAVKEYLVKEGIAAGRLTTISYGETRLAMPEIPTPKNKESKEAQTNRRVHFEVIVK